MIIRKKCVFCENNNFDYLYQINKMPAFMGVVDQKQEFVFEDMIFIKCKDCGEIQLKNLLNIDLVYLYNHNTEIVGELWKKHYEEFIKFIGNNILEKVILEIGDPSAKIAKLTDIYKKWIILEKNPNIKSKDKIIFKKGLFDDKFNIKENIDILIHSHLLEHIYEPLTFFRKCREILNEEGDIFFSIPDMGFFLKNNFSPNSILHFEHTYYLDDFYLKKICEKTGFKIVKSYKFMNHSLFYHLKKSNFKIKKFKPKQILSKQFICLYNIHFDKIKKINNIISKEKNVFIYGAHISSQFYIFNGLDTSKIIGILDSASSKNKKYLYGTNLQTFNPSIISEYNKVIVIASHMGIYYKEICYNLKKINKNTIII